MRWLRVVSNHPARLRGLPSLKRRGMVSTSGDCYFGQLWSMTAPTMHFVLLRDHLVAEVGHAIAATVFRDIQRLVGNSDEVFFGERIYGVI